MATFRAPTMSLLGRCAANDKLPQAASILTLVGSIIGAFRFDAYELIINLGTGFAFAIGSFSLLIAAFILRRLNPSNLSRDRQRQNQPVKTSLLLLCLIFTTGIWVSWSLKFIMPAVNEILKLQFGADNGKLAMTIFTIFLGLAALPAGKIATEFNNFKTMLLGAMGTIFALILLTLMPSNILPIFLLIICFSLILNGILPLILNMVPSEKSGLGMGLYFGGLGAGMSSFDLTFARFKIIDFEINIIYAIVFLCLLCCWLIFFKKQSTKNDLFNIL